MLEEENLLTTTSGINSSLSVVDGKQNNTSCFKKWAQWVKNPPKVQIYGAFFSHGVMQTIYAKWVCEFSPEIIISKISITPYMLFIGRTMNHCKRIFTPAQYFLEIINNLGESATTCY